MNIGEVRFTPKWEINHFHFVRIVSFVMRASGSTLPKPLPHLSLSVWIAPFEHLMSLTDCRERKSALWHSLYPG